jgi:hypothetical protein
MKTHQLLLATVFAWLSASGVQAAEAELTLPGFDLEAYCAYASMNSDGGYDTKQCREEERRSADLIRQQWSQIPREIQITCSEIVRRSGQSYFILKACLKNFAGANWSNWQDDREILDRSQQISRSFQRR